MVEQRTENPCVPGSIPGGTTKGGGWNDTVAAFPFVARVTGFLGKTKYSKIQSKTSSKLKFSTNPVQKMASARVILFENRLKKDGTAVVYA